MNFIDNPKAAIRHYSTIALAFATFLQGAWLAMPDAMKASFPAPVNEAVSWLTFGIVMAGLFGKFIDQTPRLGFPPIDPPQPKDTP